MSFVFVFVDNLNTPQFFFFFFTFKRPNEYTRLRYAAHKEELQAYNKDNVKHSGEPNVCRHKSHYTVMLKTGFH